MGLKSILNIGVLNKCVKIKLENMKLHLMVISIKHLISLIQEVLINSMNLS